MEFYDKGSSIAHEAFQSKSFKWCDKCSDLWYILMEYLSQ